MLFSLVFLLFTIPVESRPKIRTDIACSVCEVVVHLIDEGINATTETHTIQTRFRIDTKKRTPYRRTEFRILEVIDNDVPDKMKRYNIKLRKKWLEAGEKNRRKGKKLVRIAADKTVSKKVQRDVRRVYERMIDDHGDAIVQFFREENTDIRKKICVDMISVCESVTEEEQFKSDLTPPPPTPPPPMPEWNLNETNATSNETNATEVNATTGTNPSTDVKENVKEILDAQMKNIREQQKIMEQEMNQKKAEATNDDNVPVEVKTAEENNVDASAQVDTANDDASTPEHE